jgi:hypothetical protein
VHPNNETHGSTTDLAIAGAAFLSGLQLIFPRSSNSLSHFGPGLGGNGTDGTVSARLAAGEPTYSYFGSWKSLDVSVGIATYTPFWQRHDQLKQMYTKTGNDRGETKCRNPFEYVDVP